MNQKSTPSPKEKDFPKEWKVLFLGINQSLDLVEFVQELIRKIIDGGTELRSQFISLYSKDYRVKVNAIVAKKIDLDFPEARKVIRPFYIKSGVNNLTDFKKRLKQIATPPQSQEPRA